MVVFFPYEYTHMNVEVVKSIPAGLEGHTLHGVKPPEE